MAKISVDLQDGFDKDSIIVRVNGETIRALDNVTTNRLLGLATSVDVSPPQGNVDLEIEVPTRGILQRFQITDEEDLFLGVSVDQGALETIRRHEPFQYS